MYKQSIDQIKVAIIPLDGIILDLNRFRYNYYHHLCDKYHKTCDKQEFYAHLSNMYDMYEKLPLGNKVDVGPLNAKIERELYEYLSYKGIKPKEGFLELLECLHQKNIQVAIMSTHRTKDAVKYLKMIKIYDKVQFIIGSDTSSLPLPSTQILETIKNHFQVSNEEVLVFSSFMSLNIAANKLQMNVLYCEDLVEAGEEEEKTSYKCSKNIFDALNVLLFDRYNEAQMYSPILGMNNKMNHNELDQVRDKLQETYQDDPEIIHLIDQTYAYHVSQLSENNNREEILIDKPVTSFRKFIFDDEEEAEEDIKEESLEIEDEVDDSHEEHINTLNVDEENELTMLLQQINKPKESTIKVVTDYQEIKDIVKSSIEDDEDNKDDEANEKLDSNVFLDFILNIINVIAMSFLIVFVGLIIYIAFMHQFEEGVGIFRFITILFDVYYHFIEVILQSLFDGLHQFIQFIPSYADYALHNTVFSIEGIRLFNLFIFHILIISIIKIITFIIKRISNNEDNIQED